VRRRPRSAPLLRVLLATALLLLWGFELTVAIREGWLTLKTLLPLELCDAALLLAVVTLLRPRRAAAELLYFWAGSGTLLALVTPDLAWGFPRWEFVVFFALHGLVIVAALVLVFGLGMHPRRGAVGRALLCTAAWAVGAGVVNVLLGTNFMYLRRKPVLPTPLDWMGPWPVYIGVGAGVAYGLFTLLALPFGREAATPRWEKAS
jgi:hypothetical integral membrane protein (TIGR02206 family)